MAIINYAKDKLLDLQLKTSPKQLKVWRNIPATKAEIKKSYIEAMEKCSGKNYQQLLEGSAENYSYARRMMVEKNDLMEVLGIGPSALAYQKTRLDPIRKTNGEIDYSKIKSKYEKFCKDPDVVSTWFNALRDTYQDTLEISNEMMIDRNDLLKYFPNATRIYEVKGTNIIYINADFIDISAHVLDYVSAYDYENFWEFQKENMFLDQNTKNIYEQIEEYRKRCGYEKLDNIKFSEWIHSTRNSWRNHYYAISDLLIGGQFYINKCIDQIDEFLIQKEMKEKEFLTIKTSINPLTDYMSPEATRSEKIKYIENIEYQMHVEYEDQYIRSMREDGILK